MSHSTRARDVLSFREMPTSTMLPDPRFFGMAAVPARGVAAAGKL
jgi:hypothetical protein